MSDSYLILGATGMAGTAIYKELWMRRKRVIGLSRNGPDIKLDLLYDQHNLKQIISTLNPKVIQIHLNTKLNFQIHLTSPMKKI